MSQDQVERARRLVGVLALDPSAEGVLTLLAALDIDSQLADEHQSADEAQRRGVLSWRRMLALGEGSVPREALERAVRGLVGWGLVQVVGQSPSDPRVPGSAALRLTHAGRVGLDLAPTELAPSGPPPALEEEGPWELWHGASREGLLWELRQRFGPGALRPLRLEEPQISAAGLAGQVALSLQAQGFAIVDGFGAAQAGATPLVEELFWRARSARGPRVLVSNGPAIARVAALATGARLRWVEVPLHGSQHTGFFDERVTRRLHGEGRPGAPVDVTGMPESDLALPRRVDVRWDDLLVPPVVRHQLDQALQHARYRMDVLPGEPGFAGRGSGYRLLLSGLPGTGKTLAAEALAAALDRPLLRLDLSAILSKWLGETEKFLSQVFEAAEAGGCVLVLDEAEALFRQRESGGESGGGGGDGMKTVVAYLLVRLERYSGVLVATTNRSKDLDEAFFRRFDDYVVIPVPDEGTRLVLWRRMLGVDRDPSLETRLDLGLLSRRFAIPGALIRGAAIRARAWSSGLSRPLDMPLLLAGLARELEKNDKTSNEVYAEPWRAEVMGLLRGG